MFLRRKRRAHNGIGYDYWQLVRTVRTPRGPRQQVVANLGKLDDDEVARWRNASWSDLDDLLLGLEPAVVAPELPGFGSAATPARVGVDVLGVRLECCREFGTSYLGLSLWRRLGLHELIVSIVGRGREALDWERVACTLAIAHFCECRSEREIAGRWVGDTALCDLLSIDPGLLNETRLYRGLDELHACKDDIFRHLQARYSDWFGVRYEFLLYDVTSTYFEGEAAGNAKALRGYSRDQRPGNKQVCIGLVCSPEGLPLAYEVFDGNRNDVTTVEEIVRLMEEKYGQAERVWVMDRGMVSEHNLEWLRGRGAFYIVGAKRGELRRHEGSLLDKTDWHEVEPGVKVKLLPAPDGCMERFVVCRREGRRQKEGAMLERQRRGLLRELQDCADMLAKGSVRDARAIERRVGRWQGRYPAAAALYEIEVVVDASGQATGLRFEEKPGRFEHAALAHGVYLLRTNHPETDPQRLWKWYIQLTQAESCFRTVKNDIGLRPVYHQKTLRVESHILVCFLALAMRRTLEGWMENRGLGTSSHELIKEMERLQMADVVLPTQEVGELRLRVVCRPEPELEVLLVKLGLKLPLTPKPLSNVVPK